MFSTVWAPGSVTEGESFLWYRPSPRLQLGTALLWKQGAFRGLASYTVAPETATRPMVNVGVGLQGIATGNPGYFATLEKTLLSPAGALNGFLGVGFRANEDHAHPIAGLKFTPTDSRLTLGFQADGHDYHPFVSHRFTDLTLGLYLVRMKSLGVLVSFGW